jgi:hypothetical protein
MEDTPATPPGMRVRTRRFEKLRSFEPGESNAVEIIYRQHAMQVRAAAVPPTPARSSNLGADANPPWWQNN